jgi:hypothetical protein
LRPSFPPMSFGIKRSYVFLLSLQAKPYWLEKVGSFD